jgi:ankyrin repeat protein
MHNASFFPMFDADTLRFLQQVFQWVRAGDSAALASVLAAGLPPRLRNAQGDSLLILAAYHGHPGVARLLLEAGADPEVVNDRGQTALGAAAFRGNKEVLRLLLDHGARPDSPPGGRTAFFIAAMFNRVEMMEILRQRGADPFASDAQGLDALRAAEKMGAEEAADLIRRWTTI